MIYSKRAITFALCAVLLGAAAPARALDAYDLTGLVGYTVIASTRVKGDYYGVDAGKPVVLENGMAFAFATSFSTYAYRSPVVVFARTDEKAGTAGTYKLVVADRLYDVTRIK